MSYKSFLAIFGIALVLIGIAVTVFFPSGNTRGSNWEQITTIMYDTEPNTATYNVEAAGWDVRVIEWSPNGNTDYRCMFVAGTGKAGSACYPVKKRS